MPPDRAILAVNSIQPTRRTRKERRKRGSPSPPSNSAMRSVLENAALVFADDDAAGIKRRFEHRKGFARFGVSTHEDVESRITFFRPCMDADMAFGEDGHSG